MAAQEMCSEGTIEQLPNVQSPFQRLHTTWQGSWDKVWPGGVKVFGPASVWGKNPWISKLIEVRMRIFMLPTTCKVSVFCDA